MGEKANMQKTKSSKALTAAIALALTLGITGAANAADYTEIIANAGQTQTVTDPDITVTASNRNMYAPPGSPVVSAAVEATNGGTITLGNAETGNITVSASGDNPAGIMADHSTSNSTSSVSINGNNLNVNANTSNENGVSVGLAVENDSTMTVNTENTTIKVSTGMTAPSEGEYEDIGIMAYSRGQMDINSNLEINARTAISTRGNAVVNINKNGNRTVKMNGNINFDSGEKRPGSGGISDASININLNNAESYLHGNTVLSGNATEQADQFSKYASLRVANGAEWTADGVAPTGASDVNVISYLTVDNGKVDTGKKLTVFNELDESNGATVRADNVQIGTVLPDKTYSNATAKVGSGASLTAQNLSVNQNSTVNANDGGTVTASDTATVNGTVNVNNGGTVNANRMTVNNAGTVSVENGGTLSADNLTAQSGSHLNSDTGSNVTLDNATLDEGANVNLDGTTTVNNSLTNNAGGTISHLVLGTPDVTVSGTGTTRVSNLSLDGNAPFTKDGTYRTLNGSGLDVTDAAVDVSNLHVNGADSSLRGGQTARMTLLDNNTGHALGSVTGAANQPFTQGTTLQGTGRASLSGNDVIYTVNISNQAQPQTHSAVMAQDAGLTTIVNGFDYISRAAETMQDQGLNTFASFGGGENRYDTGSHIKTNDWHLVAGVGVKNTRENGSGTEYGVFFDYGDGRYRTFQGAGRGDGKAIYRGGGLFGKYTTPSQFYVEGSFRAGRVKNNADGIFHDALGRGYDFKTNTNYNAFHIGVGQIYSLNDKDNLDVYGKFFHTHLNSDSFNAGGHYDLDSVDSNLLRIGARWNHKQGNWTHYLGVAYEYEFDGEAKGTADGARIKSADIGGSSGRFELGTKVEVGNWTIGANANAYVGNHRGVMGEVTASLKF